jgi:hypothetical protein
MFAEDTTTGLARGLCIDGEWERAFEVEMAPNPHGKWKAQRFHFGQAGVSDSSRHGHAASPRR